MRVSWLLSDVRRSVTRNRAGFLMTTAVQVVCLTLLGLFALASVGLARFTAEARRQIEIQAFLEPGADPAAVESRIGRIAGVAATRYVSSEEALADLRAELGADSTVLAVLEANPLPASIRVTLAAGAAGPEELADVERKLALLPGVAEVFSGAETLARLGRILRVLTLTTLAVILLSSLAVIFIAFSTVESSLRARSREIEIMELVGATRTAVRLPFIVEGGLQGLFSGLAAALLVLLLLAIARALLVPFPLPVGPVVAAGALLGLALGLSGSAFALGHLDQ
ncbi:MAG TPA: FtsX-like permease family protein [candidate division WOR-3 bacterium]|uniref:Cell division protein FtsX n=1 Tax=candidate division WOR-3 bacterium TaxID=2052148 RepID=A0A7V0T5R5_UNCW3|nr:FtsX-like permease family protein [candidate division WOR-3 bacterium]